MLLTTPSLQLRAERPARRLTDDPNLRQLVLNQELRSSLARARGAGPAPRELCGPLPSRSGLRSAIWLAPFGLRARAQQRGAAEGAQPNADVRRGAAHAASCAWRFDRRASLRPRPDGSRSSRRHSQPLAMLKALVGSRLCASAVNSAEFAKAIASAAALRFRDKPGPPNHAAGPGGGYASPGPCAVRGSNISLAAAMLRPRPAPCCSPIAAGRRRSRITRSSRPPKPRASASCTSPGRRTTWCRTRPAPS